MLTDNLIRMAIAQAIVSKRKIVIYKYAKTIVMTPEGYTIPRDAEKLGEADAHGNFIDYTKESSDKSI